MTIKIGIDALPLQHSLTGIGRYTHEIIKALSKNKEIELYLYTNQPLKTNIAAENIHLRLHPAPLRVKKFWQQFMLGTLIQKDNLDVFWSPRHHLPFNTKAIPLVLTIHDLVYCKAQKTMQLLNLISEKLLFSYSTKKAQHIISVSDATKQSLIAELHLPASKITTIHSGFIKQNQKANTQNPIDKPFVLFLGTLEPRKNISRLIDAYLTLPNEIRAQHQLVLAGGTGWKSKKLLKKIHAHPQDIQYLGYVDDQTANALLTHATVFAFPSLYEGFGLPILEAMSAGAPVLTSTDPACQEIAGDAALLIDPYDQQAITSALAQLLTQAPLRSELTDKGYRNIERFSWEKAAQAHLEIFKNVINQK